MNPIEKNLAQLKNIEPDPNYARTSRAALLNLISTKNHRSKTLGWFFKGLQSASAIALTSILFMLAVGSLKNIHSLTPFKLTSLDTATIAAEADAIGIQIQLSNLAYKENSDTNNIASTTSPTETLKKIAEIKEQVVNSITTKSVAEDKTEAPSTTINEVSIDEALNILTQ